MHLLGRSADLGGVIPGAKIGSDAFYESGRPRFSREGALRYLGADIAARRRRNIMKYTIQYDNGKCKSGKADGIYERHNRYWLTSKSIILTTLEIDENSTHRVGHPALDFFGYNRLRKRATHS
jgi:hypothetical protein